MLLKRMIVILPMTALCILLCACQGSTDGSQDASHESFSMDAADREMSEAAPEAETTVSNVGTPLADELSGAFQAVADETALDVAITFIDLENPQDSCSVDGVAGKPSASMIKLLILNELMDQVNQGLVSLDESYTLTSSDLVGGTGTLQGRGAGATTTFREMAQLMISASDNVATNVIIDRIGMGAINEQAAQLGLTGTSLNRYMMDTEALAAGVDNYMSSSDAATLLRMVYDGTFVNSEASRFALDALKAQTDGNGIAGGLGNVEFAHKTGTLSNAQNDAGIVLGEHPYVLSVFCTASSGGYFSQAEAYNVMTRCAQLAENAVANLG